MLGTQETKRFQALNELIRLGDKSIEPTRKVLDNRGEPSTRRWQAAKVLGALKAEVALPELLKALDSDHSIVTGAAAEALGRGAGASPARCGTEATYCARLMAGGRGAGPAADVRQHRASASRTDA